MNRRRRTGLDPRRQTILVVVAALVIYGYLVFRTGGLPSTLDIIKTIFYFLLLDFEKIPQNVRALMFDSGLLFMGTLLWIAFFAQFAVPVRTVGDRYRAFERLTMYMSGQIGPTIFVESGGVRQRPHEMERQGLGLVLLDTASGAVARKDVRLTKVIGPGAHFLERGEYLAGAVNLYRQVEPRPPLGPRRGDEPFLNGNPNDSDYQKVQERRHQTSGLTRDGVEIVPNILAVYHLERPADGDELSFGYNPDAVRRWVIATGILSQKQSQEGKPQIPLKELPAYMTADLWREYLQKFRLEELFSAPLDENGLRETALATIMKMVHTRLTRPEVEELDNFGQPTGRKRPSAEYRILKGYGITVVAGVINSLRFSPSIERKLVDDWIATWLQRAQAERERLDRLRSLNELEGKRDALLHFALASARKFDDQVFSQPKYKTAAEEFEQLKDAVDRLSRGTITLCVSDPQLYQSLNLEVAEVSELINWIRVQESP